MEIEEIIDKFNNFTQKHLSTAHGYQSRTYLLKEYYNYCQKVIDSIIATYPEFKFECGPGCGYCCRIRVEVLPIEALYISDYLLGLPKETLSQFEKKLTEHVAYAHGLTMDEYERYCPFISEDRKCLIYSVRPQKCRVFFSRNKQACIDLDEIQQSFPLLMAVNALSTVFINNLKRKNHNMNPYELGEAVLIALGSNKQIKQKWMDSEQIYPLLPENTIL
jgi:Fe-S-cluster containining protein